MMSVCSVDNESTAIERQLVDNKNDDNDKDDEMYACDLHVSTTYPSPSSLIFVSLQTGSTKPILILQDKQKRSYESKPY